MYTFHFRKRLIILCMLFSISLVHAQLQLPQIFSDGAIFQRELPIPVHGSSSALDTIIVTLSADRDTTIADSSGDWQLILDPLQAGGPFTMLIENGSQIKILNDIYIGDVWLASGQSNMEMTISGVDNAATVISNANDQKIRQFKIPKGLANEPSDVLPAGSLWRPATSAYVADFSAVGYFFARDIRAELDIPIGIINCSYGGSRIETWMSDAMLGFDEQDVVLASGEAERQPTVAYNKMLYPLLKTPVKGFLWYQGESNADNMDDALAYRDLFQTMITSWRELWGLGDIPFLWVQLPNYGTVFDEPQVWDAWPQLRDGQSAALKLPNTGEAVTIDVGGEDIHPTHKEPVGQRLALVARKVAYSEDIVYSGPRYKSNLLREDGKIEINFNHIGGGLITSPDESDSVRGFAVADINDNLSWASAIIDSNKVLVWSDAVADPVRVRYAWEYNPATINLYNAEMLPAAPFNVDVNPGFGITTFKSGRSAVENGQSTTLTWQVFGSDNITLDGSPVDSAETITITPDTTHSYLLIAINRDDANDIDSAAVTVEVLDPDQINRALNHPVKASTIEACCGQDQLAGYAVDGDFATRWSSAWSTTADPLDPNTDDDPDDEWIYVDFGESIDINRVILYWEPAYGSAYDLDVSYDGYLWNTVYSEQNGNGAEDNIVFDDLPSGRFLRMHGHTRATQWGYSLFEIAAYGVLAEKKPPTIALNTNKGNVLAPSATVTVTANTSDSDGEISQVSFYADGNLIASATEAPFQTEWQAGAQGVYNLTAIVVDNDTLTVQSDTFKVYIRDNSFVTYEAEDAVTTGQATRISNTAVSGRAYMDLKDAWTITWDSVTVPSAGSYLMSIGYKLTYESPKSQYLVVNGDTVDVVEFTAPNTASWLQKGIMVALQEGINSIALHGFWNWMSLDFIAIQGATVVSLRDETVIPEKLSLSQNYPNPFNPLTRISYSLPQNGHVLLEIFDVTGRKVSTLVNREQSPGYYTIEFNGQALSSGTYFYRLKFANKSVKKSMILIK
jgi:Carbohydrate esterase, sialic acid-specific acetylesterase/F5/8 type C domain/Bacterial Ig domain/Carbohydrate binding module (family 35)/Secretion system C-terminal sorting domain